MRVLAANPSDGNSQWTSDIENLEGKITNFEPKYPSVLTQSSLTFFQKIEYRLALLRVKAGYKGNYYDRSSSFRLEHVPGLIARLNSKEIETLIVSAGPFSWLSEFLRIKQYDPEIQLIADFRDPWMSNTSFYGYAELSDKRKAYELNLERQTIKGFNKIISVSEEMNAYFAQRHTVDQIKFHVLPNGWDKDELVEPIQNRAERRLIFSGTLYDQTEYAFSAFIRQINTPDIKMRIEKLNVYFDFYGVVPPWFASYSNARVQYKGKLNLAEVNAVQSNAVGGLLFLTKDMTFSLSTKFFEYLKYGLPIFVFAERGPTSEFVEKEEIGLGLSPNDGPQKMESLLNMIEKNQRRKPTWVDDYEVRELTNELLKIINV